MKRREFTLFNKLDFRNILFLCLFFLVLDILKFFNLAFNKKYIIVHHNNFLFSIGAGLIVAYVGISIAKYKEEAVALIVFATSLLIKPFGKFIGYQLSLLFIIFLDLTYTYFFWVTYKTYKQNFSEYGHISRKRIFLISLFLLLPPLLIWFIAIIQNQAQH